MITYEEVYDQIVEKYDKGEITYEQAVELNDAAFEKYVTSTVIEEEVEEVPEVDDSIFESCVADLVCEGANSDVISAVNANTKNTRELLKKAKKAIKDNDKKSAKKYLDEIIATNQDTKKKISSIKFSKGENVLSVATGLMVFIKGYGKLIAEFTAITALLTTVVATGVGTAQRKDGALAITVPSKDLLAAEAGTAAALAVFNDVAKAIKNGKDGVKEANLLVHECNNFIDRNIKIARELKAKITEIK